MKRTERSQIQIGHVEFYDTRGNQAQGVPPFIVYTSMVLQLTFTNC